MVSPYIGLESNFTQYCLVKVLLVLCVTGTLCDMYKEQQLRNLSIDVVVLDNPDNFCSTIDLCLGKKGGALLSALYSNMQHGDPFVKSLVRHILNLVGT